MYLFSINLVFVTLLWAYTSFSGCTSFRFCYFNNSVKCPCNVIHDSVTLIFTFLIIIIIIISKFNIIPY